MDGPIVAIDTSEIREGRLEDVKATIQELAEFVDANEPRPIAYNAYLDESSNRLTVLQDSASLEHHMRVAGPAFPKFTELIRMGTMDVYGEPSEQLLGSCGKRRRCWETSRSSCTRCTPGSRDSTRRRARGVEKTESVPTCW